MLHGLGENSNGSKRTMELTKKIIGILAHPNILEIASKNVWNEVDQIKD